MIHTAQKVMMIALCIVLLSWSWGVDECPNQIKGVAGVDMGDETLQDYKITIAGETPYLKAKIDTVNLECFPVKNPAVKTARFEREAYTDFQIAITVNISYEILNKVRFNEAENNLIRSRGQTAEIKFEAVADSGVVIGSSTEKMHFVSSGTRGTVSSKIYGLSYEEISKVSFVRAFWTYKR